MCRDRQDCVPKSELTRGQGGRSKCQGEIDLKPGIAGWVNDGYHQARSCRLIEVQEVDVLEVKDKGNCAMSTLPGFSNTSVYEL